MKISVGLPTKYQTSGATARHSPDLQWNDWSVEFLTTSTMRDLRSSMVEFAYAIKPAADSEADLELQHGGPQWSSHFNPRWGPSGSGHALIVLVDSKVSTPRLRDELESFRAIARPQIAKRVHLARYSSAQPGLEPIDPLLHLPAGLEAEVLRNAPKASSRQSAPSAQHAVTTELFRHWLIDAEPVSRANLQSRIGASYPTVANALKHLDAKGLLEQTSDRRVSLRFVPQQEWQHWLVSAVQARKSEGFVDPTGTGRKPGDMAQRLFKLGRDDLAVGGVIGARHFHPELDIAGEPRLDITLHNSTDLSFVRKLDAGLRPAAIGEKPSLVVHFTSGTVPPFVKTPEGTWADPLECLVDLYEMGLYAQAQEFLSYLLSKHRQEAQFRIVA